MRISLRQLVIAAIAASLLWTNLQAPAQSPAPKSPPPKSPPPGSLPTYEDVTAKSGINFKHSFGEQKLSSIMEATGSGCAWIDYNNDGLLDLYVVSGRYIDGATKFSKPDGQDATNHLYRNNGDGTFTDVTAQAGVGGKGFGMGVTVGDYDNDGYEDIFVTNWGSSRLGVVVTLNHYAGRAALVLLRLNRRAGLNTRWSTPSYHKIGK